MIEQYELESASRNGRVIISIRLGNRYVGSILLEREDEEFMKDIDGLMKKWNDIRKERL